MIDAISGNICQRLPGGEWTWAVQKAGWGRIYRSTWTNKIPAGHLKDAVRNGQRVHGEYPMLWFELKPNNPNQKDGAIIVRVPLDVKGFARTAAGYNFEKLLKACVRLNNNRWPAIREDSIKYLADMSVGRVLVDELNVNHGSFALNETGIVNYITQRYAVIDDAFQSL